MRGLSELLIAFGKPPSRLAHCLSPLRSNTFGLLIGGDEWMKHSV